MPETAIATATIEADVRIDNPGGLAFLTPLSDYGRDWCEDEIGDETTRFQGSIVVEPDYLDDLIDGLLGAGVLVSFDGQPPAGHDRDSQIQGLIDRADRAAAVPTGYRLSGPYPKVGEHDTCIAERDIPETRGTERVYRNRTGRRYVYVLTAFGMIRRAGITTSPRKGERWAGAVRAKARLYALLDPE